ncbi:MAG: hypothetical protein PHG63_00700 [Candidatus Dojkabacteria bacterium]|nr:hypothetical protein [Candidatus Dojkabacteria bacterium]
MVRFLNTKTLVVLLLLVVIGFTFVYLTVPKPFQQQPSKPLLFPTSAYPNHVQWISDDQLLLADDRTISLFDTSSRLTTTELSLSGETVLDISGSPNTLTVLTATQHSVIVRNKANAWKTTAFPFTQAQSGILGTDTACISHHSIITDPSMIATNALLLTNAQDGWGVSKEKGFHLSLVPTVCSGKTLWIPAQPFLKPSLYQWDLHLEEPRDLSIPISLEGLAEYRFANRCTGIRIGTSVAIFSLEDGRTTTFKPKVVQTLPEKLDAWNLTTDCLPVYVIEDTITYFTPDGSHTDVHIPNMADLRFSFVHPSPSMNTFALISRDGQLWILML